jgi:hypothetical protein
MAESNNQRLYNITDSEFTLFTQHICDCITRDITEFEAFNVLAADVTNLQSPCDALRFSQQMVH